jgi:hypothetical protein
MAFVVVTGTGDEFNMIVAIKLHMEVFGSSLMIAREDLDPIYSASTDRQFHFPVEFTADDTGKAARFVHLARRIGIMCHLRSGLYD